MKNGSGLGYFLEIEARRIPRSDSFLWTNGRFFLADFDPKFAQKIGVV